MWSKKFCGYLTIIIFVHWSLVFCEEFLGLTIYYNYKTTINSPINILIVSRSLSSKQVTFELHTEKYVITSFMFSMHSTGQKFQPTKNINSICNNFGIKSPVDAPPNTAGYYVREIATFYEQGENVMALTVSDPDTQKHIINKKYKIIVTAPSNKCLPKITFNDCSSPHNPRKIAFHRKNIIQAVVLRGCGMDSNINLKWEINDFLDKVTRSTFPEENSRTLKIPAFKLWFDDIDDPFHKMYTIKITVEEKSANGSVTGTSIARCYVAVITALPIAKIKYGSQRKINTNKPFSLDGSLSRDMASPKEGVNLKYIWSCSSNDISNKLCQVVTVPARSLVIGQTYKFSLEVESRRTFHGSKTIQEIIPSSEDPLLLSHICIRNCFNEMANRNEIMHMIAVCENCKADAAYEWRLLKPENKDLKTGSRLIFPASQFPKESDSLTFKLDAFSGVQRGTFIFEVKLMKFNRIGRCSVDPKQGEEYSTYFKIICYNFESDNEPLTYAIFQDDQLILSQQNSEILLKLSKSKGDHAANLRLEIYDTLHVTANIQLSIPLQSPEIPSDAIGVLTFLNKVKLRDAINSGDMTAVVTIARIAAEKIKLLKDPDAKLKLTEHFLDLLINLSPSTTEDVERLSSLLKNLVGNVTSKDTLAEKTSYIFDIASKTLSDSLKSYDIIDLSTERCINMTQHFVEVAEKFFEPIEQFPKVHTIEVDRAENYEEENYPDYDELDFDVILRINNWKRSAEATRKLFQQLGLAAFYITEAEEDDFRIVTGGVLWQMIVKGSEHRQLISLANDQVLVEIPSTLMKDLMHENQQNGKVGVQTIFAKENPYWWYPDQHKPNSMIVINVFTSIFPNNNFSVSNVSSYFDTYFKLTTSNNNSITTTTKGHVLPKDDMPIYECIVPRNSFMGVEFLATNSSIKVLIKIGDMPKYREMLKSDRVVIEATNPLDDILYNSDVEARTGYIALYPHGNVNKPISFEFKTSIYSCSNWDPQDERWSIAHCRVGSNTNLTHIHCQCNHFSHFAAYLFKTPNSLELPRAVITSLQANFIFMFMFMTMLLILLGLFFWSKHRDQTDQVLSEIIFTEPYDPEKEYLYLVTISTGSYKQAGTTANIAIRLVGEHLNSIEYVLSCRKIYKAFRRKSETTFGLLTHQYLGPIQSVVLINDYSGRYPSWYCNFIRVKDPARQEEFVFFVNRWLSKMYHTSLQIEVKLATEEYMTSNKYVITEHFRRCFTEMYLWYGLFYPHARSPLNRKEKAIVFVTGFCFGTMLSLMFFQRTSLDNVEDERIKYKRFILKFSNILHTILCTIAGMLLAMGVGTLFLKSKKSSSLPFKVVYGKNN